MFFKCKHPAKHLTVYKPETSETKDGDFRFVTYHLLCTNCGADVKLQSAQLIGGVDAFLKRGNVDTNKFASAKRSIGEEWSRMK